MAFQLFSMPPAAASFSTLPTELLVSVILQLEWRQVLRIQSVCKSLDEIIRSHVAIRYHIELGIANMVDGPSNPSSPFSTDERLARLRKYQRRWRHFEVSQRQIVRHVRGGVWELSQGVLAQGTSSPEGVRELYFKRLPIGSRADAKGFEWTHKNYGFSIRDFTLDPSQDFLLLVRGDNAQSELPQHRTLEIHLRSLRTNKPHPLAKSPVLTHKLAGGSSRYSHIMQICGDRFAILHSGEFEPEIWHEKFVVYNWKTGQKEMELQFCGISSFCFLSERYLLLAVKPFIIIPAGFDEQQPRLLVCDIERTSKLDAPGDRNSFVAIAEFQLPEMNQFIEVMDVSIRSDPAPSVTPEGEDAYDKVIPPVAFMTAPENRLFTITYHVATVPEDTGDHRAIQVQSLVLFVPLKTFNSHLSSPSTSASAMRSAGEIIRSSIIQTEAGFFVDDSSGIPGVIRARQRSEGGIAVPWEDWMKEGARALLVPSAERIWVCNVYGSRYVHAVEPIDPDAPRMARHVAILDFNVDSLKYEAAKQTTASDSDSYDYVDVEDEKERSIARVWVDYEPTTLQASSCGIFDVDVTTSLPYRRTVLREKTRFDGVMLTEDNVVFVNHKAPKEYEVLTF